MRRVGQFQTIIMASYSCISYWKDEPRGIAWRPPPPPPPWLQSSPPRPARRPRERDETRLQLVIRATSRASIDKSAPAKNYII